MRDLLLRAGDKITLFFKSANKKRPLHGSRSLEKQMVGPGFSLGWNSFELWPE